LNIDSSQQAILFINKFENSMFFCKKTLIMGIPVLEALQTVCRIPDSAKWRCALVRRQVCYCPNIFILNTLSGHQQSFFK
jgi:hypothetical protein